ncbi:MAG TPA: zf-HC2 domain-containing protein, partial [Longimicrobium sp.]|nr:zf-HC2 domain-containing protein [Longimicrobium sp.]
MTLTLGSRPQHLEDGDLVRYMDRQLDRTGNRRVELHLAACAECAARAEAMQARSRQMSAWLADLDVPAPDDEKRALAMAAVERARFRARAGWGGRPALAAAAMVAMLLTVAFGSAPGRAWVSGAVERLGGVLPGQTEQEQAASRATSPAAGPAA